jgi:signal transduction histidine kinase
MRELTAHVIVPINLKDSLVGFLALGERQSKDMYSKGLLNALSVVGHQSALAIDRCHYIEAEAKRWEEESLMERRKSLDHLVASMAHEIDNPMGIILGQASYARDFLKEGRTCVPDEVRKELIPILDHIMEAQGRVSGMVKAIEEYSKKAPGELTPITIYEVEKGYAKLAGKSFSLEDVKYTKEVADNLPNILGDRIQLEEVLINFANNARHAVRNAEVKKVHLKIFQKDNDWIRIEFSDTGYGIENKLLKDIFLPYVTTKGSSEGTGMGLHHVRRIIELHKGRIWAESEGKSKGATMIVELPVYKGEISNTKSVPDKKMF